MLHATPSSMQTHQHHQQRRRRLSVGAATAVAVAAAASAANGTGVQGFHVATPPPLAAEGPGPAAVGSTGSRQAHIRGCRYRGDASGGWRLLHHRGRVAGPAGASGGPGPFCDSGLCFCVAGGGRAETTSRRLGRTSMHHSRIGDGSSRTSGIWGDWGVGWPVRELGPTTAQQQQQQQQRWCRGRRSDDRSPSPSALMMVRAGSGGGGGGGSSGDRYSFKKKGDLPSLVVGAGILVARHRSSIRAGNERRNVVIKTGDSGGGVGGGRVSHDEEEAAAVAKIGGGVGATVSAASAGLRMGLGEVSTSRRFAAAGGSGSGGERRSGAGRQRQRRKTPGSGPSALASTRGRGGGGGEWEETGEWQDEDGTQEGEMMDGGGEEWTEVEEATDERQQQRRSTEAEVRGLRFFSRRSVVEAPRGHFARLMTWRWGVGVGERVWLFV